MVFVVPTQLYQLYSRKIKNKQNSKISFEYHNLHFDDHFFSLDFGNDEFQKVSVMVNKLQASYAHHEIKIRLPCIKFNKLVLLPLFFIYMCI